VATLCQTTSENKLDKRQSLRRLFLKTKVFITGTLALSLALIGCKPNAKDLKEAIEKDPSIVFVAIEKAPDQFIEVVNKAAREAQTKQQQKEMADEQGKRDQEFKNPLKPSIDESRPLMGSKTAKITIVEFSDFECPYCSRGYSTIKEVLKDYPTEVRVLFKHLPLDFHPKALPAAKYYEAIALQDHAKAIQFHDQIFQNQDKLRKEGEDYMKKIAKDLGINMKKLEKDVASDEVMAKIQADIDEAKSFEISGTPGFIINGVSLRGAYPFSEFKAIIDKHLGK
jgi:protein-disulfide isomerase